MYYILMMHWILGAVLAVAMVMGGGYVLMSGGYSMEDSKVNVVAPELNDDVDTGDMVAKEMDKATPKLIEKAVGFTGSFFDLAARGGTYRCEVQSSGTNNSTTGVVHVAGTDIRGDFASLVSGKSVESHMLKKGDMMYVWGGGMEQGVMMKATAMQGQGSTATQGQGVSGTQDYGWNCISESVDASKFVKPSSIDFMDIDAMMQGTGR